METKITLVTGETIQLRREPDEAVLEINAALTAGSLWSVKSARGGVVWINPVQIVRVDAIAKPQV